VEESIPGLFQCTAAASSSQWLNLIKSPAEHFNFWTIEPVLHHSCSVEEENGIRTATSAVVADSNDGEGNKSPLEFNFFERPQRASPHKGQTATDTQ